MSATGITTFMSDFASQLVANSAIQTFCQDKFAKRLCVQIGQTAEEPPTVDQCPLVIITSGSRGTDESGHIRQRSVRIGINIKAAGRFTESTPGVKHHPTMALLDELADLIEDFIISYKETTGYGIASLSGGPEDVIEDDILKTWLALGVQLDSNYI